MPDIAVAWPARGAACRAISSLNSENMLTMAALINLEANRNGIIPLTFTA